MDNIKTLHMGNDINDSYLDNVLFMSDTEDPDAAMFTTLRDGYVAVRLRNYAVIPISALPGLIDDLIGPRQGLASNARYFRERLEYSIPEVSILSDLSMYFISKIEDSILVNPSLITLKKLASALRVDVTTLIDDSETPDDNA